MGQSFEEDPLAFAVAPPPNETPDQREERMRAEAEARRVSEGIDEQIKAEKVALKKRQIIKVLLLGQSESGKSTTLKNFQMAYAQKAWAEERASWRSVILLNLVRNVHTILDILTEELAKRSSSPSSPSDDDSDEPKSPRSPRPFTAPVKSNARSRTPLEFTERHRLLKLRLTPLRTVQADLERRLGAPSSEDWAKYQHQLQSQPDGHGDGDFYKGKSREFFVRSHTGWKNALRPARRSSDVGPSSGRDNDHYQRCAEERQTADLIASCADDIKALWEDRTVREMLDRLGIRLDIMPGFFLDDVDRVTKRDYVPSDSDVVRARLRTLGVQEYRILFDKGSSAGTEWMLYDVGGSRTQRAAWTPYFDDCDAIIFLAPLSCFDEMLEEDRRVNRLEDSFALWKMVCSSKLLANAQIILFLNKCDLLERKLRRGIRVKDYVPSFGNRKNEKDVVISYFASHFKEIAKHSSPTPRDVRVYRTCVVDTEATAITLNTVEEGILKAHLRQADLIR